MRRLLQANASFLLAHNGGTPNQGAVLVFHKDYRRASRYGHIVDMLFISQNTRECTHGSVGKPGFSSSLGATYRVRKGVECENSTLL